METKAELKKTDGNFEAKSDAGQPKQPAWRRRLNNFFYAVIYILVGCGVFWLVFKFSVGMDLVERCIALFATTSLGVMVAALLLTPLFNMISGVFRHFVNHIFKMPMLDICAVVLGLIIGLIIASLLNTVVGKISVIGPYISVVSLLFFAYLGMLVAHSKRSELAGLLNWRGGAAKFGSLFDAADTGGICRMRGGDRRHCARGRTPDEPWRTGSRAHPESL